MIGFGQECFGEFKKSDLTPKSKFCDGLGRGTVTGRSRLVFIPSGVKINSQRYISEILSSQLLPWAESHFSSVDTSTGFRRFTRFKNDSKLAKAKIPSFLSKDEWPSRSPDLNPLDFSLWAILESKACKTPHDSVKSLKSKLQREWAEIPQETEL